jgi:hypothetical protein
MAVLRERKNESFENFRKKAGTWVCDSKPIKKHLEMIVFHFLLGACGPFEPILSCLSEMYTSGFATYFPTFGNVVGLKSTTDIDVAPVLFQAPNRVKMKILLSVIVGVIPLCSASGKT